MAYLLRFDSVHGKFDGEIFVEEGENSEKFLVINGQVSSEMQNFESCFSFFRRLVILSFFFRPPFNLLSLCFISSVFEFQHSQTRTRFRGQETESILS